MAYIGNTPGVSSQRFVQRETVSGSAKSLFVVSSGYSLGYVDVFVNGAQLDESDFTATDGVSVTLAVAAQVGDIVRIIAWLPRGLSDGYLKSEADAKFAALTDASATANGVLYRNASKVLTTGSALTFDGTNLGIGTSSPGAKLDVNGGANSEMRLTTSGSGYLQVGQFTNGAFIGTSSTDATAGVLRLGTGGTTRATIDSSGNLGLGVTPSAWANSKAIDVGGFGSLSTDTLNDANTSLSWNAYATAYNAWKYKNTGSAASKYTQEAGKHYWYTAPSGTAGNAISFTQAMTLDASGNLLVGTTTQVGRFTLENSATTTEITLRTTGGVGINNRARIIAGYEAGGSDYGGYLAFNTTSSGNVNTERARIDSSGNLLVGTTSAIGSSSNTTAGVTFAKSYNWFAVTDSNYVQRSNNTDGSVFQFLRGSSVVGSISVTASTTAYNTSSDYRLKEDIQPMTGALAKVAALKPCTYKWKADGSDSEGFIAHELQEVVPQCVTGEKDAVDAEGKPVYQGIDTSFLVATLTAAIQELKAIVDAQAARIAVLENA